MDAVFDLVMKIEQQHVVVEVEQLMNALDDDNYLFVIEYFLKLMLDLDEHWLVFAYKQEHVAAVVVVVAVEFVVD
jgi:hypothetical protein